MSLKNSKKNVKKDTEESVKDTEESLKDTNDETDEDIEEEIDNMIQQTDENNESENNESENNECGIEKLINDDMEYFNEDNSSEIKVEQKIILLDKSMRITNPRLTKYEMVRILGERTKQLTMGAKPLVKNYQDLNYEMIAIEELKNNMIPFKIIRPLPNNRIEEWGIDELDKKHLLHLITY